MRPGKESACEAYGFAGALHIRHGIRGGLTYRSKRKGFSPLQKNGIPSFNEAVASENSEFHFSIVFTKYQHFLSANGLPNV